MSARVALALVCAGCALAACFPDAALRPIESLVVQMREPQQAVPVARAFFIFTALASLASAVAWSRVTGTVARAVAAIGAWPTHMFWSIVVATAAILRLLVAALPYEPTSDAGWYHLVAISLARGEGVSEHGVPTAFRSPGYAFLLSLLYRIAGEHVELAWVLGLLSSAVLVVAVHDIARRLYGVAVARVATLFTAAYPALVVMTGQSMSDLPFVAGMYALIAFALRVDGSRRRDGVVAGVAVGLLTLVRTVGLGLVVLVPAIWWLASRDATKYVRSASIVACVCAAVLLPWMVRNAVALDRFTIGTNGGSNLLVGSRPGASGWRDAFDYPDSVAAARTEVAVDDAMRKEAFAFIRNHPLDALAILPGKLAAMYLLETQAITSLFQGERHGSDRIRHALYGMSQLAWLAIALLVAARLASWRRPDDRPRGTQWFGWLLVCYFTAICLVFHGEDRYRLPLLPWYLIEAAVVAVLGAQRRNLSMRPLSSSSEPN